MKLYIHPKDFCKAMGWNISVPTRRNGLPPEAEQLKQLGQTPKWYFSQENIIENTYTLYYGANANTLSPLIFETDYTINLSQGYITLTATGIAKVDNDKVFATYEYLSLGISCELLSQTIDRASNMVDSLCNTTFIDGSVNHPQYQRNELILPNQGFYNRYYYFQDLPIIDINSKLITDINDTTTTIEVEGGVKFPTTGKISINRETMSYTISDLAQPNVWTVVRGTDPTEHKAGDIVSSMTVELNSRLEGFPPLLYLGQTQKFETLAYNRDYVFGGHNNIYIYETSRVYRVRTEIPGRMKLSYLSGYQSIPENIKRLTLILTKKMLASDNIMKAMIEGRNEFNPSMFNVDEQEMNSIISAYKILRMGNT